MKRFTRQIVLWAVFALFPAAVQGQWIDDYTGVLNTQENLVFQGGSGVGSDFRVQNDLIDSYVQVGPYVGAFDQGALTASFSLICVDYEAFAGSQRVNVTSVAGSDFGQTRLEGSADRYRRASYYASLFDSWEDYQTVGGVTYDRSNVWSAIHATIWSIMSEDDVLSQHGALQLAITANNADAASAYTGDGWYILSSVESPHRQEMLIRTPTATVPEPSTYLLMATGLFFLAVLGRKRRDQVEA